jgi:transcriptional regulator with XRE-family HTH domain
MALKMNSHRSAVCDGDIIREARESLRLNNTEMARYLGVSRGILNRALACETVGFGSLDIIAEKLNVTVEELTGRGKLPSKIHSIDLEHRLEEKLCRITNELNERYGIEDPAGTIRYLITTYVLTAKVIHND